MEELKYELGRYQKKVEDQQKEIRELKALIEANAEVTKVWEAFICATLMIFNADKDHPVEIKQKAISDTMREVELRIVQLEDGYRMHYEHIKAE